MEMPELTFKNLIIGGAALIVSSVISGYFYSIGADLWQITKQQNFPTSISPFWYLSVPLGIVGIVLVVLAILRKPSSEESRTKPEPEKPQAAQLVIPFELKTGSTSATISVSDKPLGMVSQIPQITVTPADDDSKKLKEIRVLLKDGILKYPANFYFVTVKNLTGPTVNDLEARFVATDGGGSGSILMIWSTGRDHLTIHKEDDAIKSFKSRKDALRIAISPEHIHSAERTVLHQGGLGKTFAIVHTNKGVDGISIPSLDSRYRVESPYARRGFQLDLYLSGDTLPTRRYASFKVSANSVTSLIVVPIPIENGS